MARHSVLLKPTHARAKERSRRNPLIALDVSEHLRAQHHRRRVHVGGCGAVADELKAHRGLAMFRHYIRFDLPADHEPVHARDEVHA